MRQSLPGIKSIGYLPCANLSPLIMQKHIVGIPVGVFSAITPIEHYGNASCEAESEYDHGRKLQKAKLKFSTTDDIPIDKHLAFVVTDAEGKSWLIGLREPPYPIAEYVRIIDMSNNIWELEVIFSHRKSLIPCFL